MKANELMIGDWVTGKKWRENPFKLSRINDNGKYYYGITSDGTQVGPFLFEEIKPIPLTEEILEKNCFICNIHNIYELSVDTDTFNNFISYQPHYGGIYICKETSEGDFLSEIQLKLQYVHELQNAMHLFKIEKEIVL